LFPDSPSPAEKKIQIQEKGIGMEFYYKIKVSIHTREVVQVPQNELYAPGFWITRHMSKL
jgi:hypothetical protein